MAPPSLATNRKRSTGAETAGAAKGKECPAGAARSNGRLFLRLYPWELPESLPE